MEININQKSYKKIIGHYVRHANNQVVGILAGNVVDKKINIVEVFPLFHYALFSSSIEFVLQYLPGDIEQLGLTIVGLYFANEVCGSIPQPVVSLLENLNSHYFSSVLLNFSNYNPIDDNNSKIGVNSINKSKISSEKAKININIGKDQINNYISKSEYLKIIDFDDYLLDPDLDYKNTFVY